MTPAPRSLSECPYEVDYHSRCEATGQLRLPHDNAPNMAGLAFIRADALVHQMKHYSNEAPVNVGSGRDVTIAELAQTVVEVVGLDGPLTKDETKPDGAPRRMLEVSVREAHGWKPTISLRDGIADAYRDYLSRCNRAV
jgi:nucleoside-diphosphate-sugar epimerase